ncbi:MAG: chalcone isomerase family protein [Pseudomonadaceae bacterium]|nr:chalcone isomerase family protein [Pseudomonadaceae bacterium]
MRHLILLPFLLLSQPSLASERLAEAAFARIHEQQDISLERRNQAVLTYLWADVYAAAYYLEPDAVPARALEQPARQRLELYYYRNIARQDLIKAAWTTLERQLTASRLAALHDAIDELHASFRDIRPGDRYALSYAPESGLRLEINGTTAFRSSDSDLARAYLGIWLAPKGLSDELREELLSER